MFFYLPEVSRLTVLRQDVSARSLKVEHATVEGAVMRIPKGDAGRRTRNAMRTTQTRSDCRHLILRMSTNVSQDSHCEKC